MKIVKSAIIGLMVGSLILMISGLFFVEDEVRMMMIGCLVMTTLIGALSRVYDSNLPLLPAAAIHLFGSYVLFFGTAYLVNLFPFKLGPIISGSLVFLIIFFMIWTGYYFSEKKKIEKMNKNLN
ncbi:DUF3021 domain-containing protein [Enterococcus pallens]|uniref:DUF3021 domain-containing protein n=1 Tax=Enterococcus pallens ATCC BAA-351 TaxID=1158607 RepID=R2QEV6_9ENTE|nr:DUF3021 domain-containing protein [Enterococcus pallens]EOH93773.1 hypothetical protein UAU_02469 [Enterococcus pallens ATCC BAA-351]EOU24613.1 hypothetical protein I588_00600 [Enterococcus pallens ATCC BAA-351]OJG79565.1 hypothetical protein RV10_GL000692 [Enterococcus pallens]